MIRKIDIEKFGLFQNYKWDTEIGKNETFRRVNVIYGRNYSGKTTLSRVLKCIEDKKLHQNYADSKFNIELSSGSSVSQVNLVSGIKDFNVRVYNSDFVKENLSWLHNDDGTINPFTILGAKNVEIDLKLKEIDVKLGSVVEQNGLLYQQQQSEQYHSTRKNAFDKKSDELDEKFKNKAKEIKNNAFIYNYTTYQINTIKGDIPKALKLGELNPEIISEKTKLLKEEPKSSVDRLKEFKPSFEIFYNQVSELLRRKIKPSEPISDLINNSLLQEWVRQGIHKHKGIRKNCGFCGNTIDESLWAQLDAHFSKESEELRNEIVNKISQLEQAKNNLNAFFVLTKEHLYSNLSSQFEVVQNQWIANTKTYSTSIDSLISKLKEREKDIFNERELGEIIDVSQTVLEVIQDVNKLVDEHNKRTSTLSKDQENARSELRLSEVASFLKSIDYLGRILENATLEEEANKARNSLGQLAKEIEDLNEEKRALEAQSQDQSKGAELVNEHLTHYFGHNELKLAAEEKEDKKIHFRIKRDGIYANNLSEGECSLISFCYFIAKMEDELNDENNCNKLIIYIDDPISSLDSNHIFFMFSLIECIIAKPKKYCQLFISTHNLDFLKYLKQLTFPKYKPTPEAKEKSDKKLLLIERKSKSKTVLKLAPEYLREYITEFNYLFFQIHKCSQLDLITIEHNYQYNFGNNMRKFLEAYLFYKYPSGQLSLDQRIQKFFESDHISYNLIRRVINEYSHLGENFDRGLEPVDVDVIKKVAQSVMNKIETTDKDQYDALIESVKNDL